MTHGANQIERVYLLAQTHGHEFWSCGPGGWELVIAQGNRQLLSYVVPLVVQGLRDGNRILAVDILMSYLVPWLGNIRLACAKIQVIINWTMKISVNSNFQVYSPIQLNSSNYVCNTSLFWFFPPLSQDKEKRYPNLQILNMQHTIYWKLLYS